MIKSRVVETDTFIRFSSRDERIADQVIRYIEQVIQPAEKLKLAENAIKSEVTAEDYSFPELKKAAKAIWDLKAPEQRRQAELFAEYASSAVYELVLERLGKSVAPPDDGRDPNTSDWVGDHEA